MSKDRTHITMLETKPGADDGMHVQVYKEGQTYEVGHSLADNFVRQQSVAVLRDAQEPEPAKAAVRGGADGEGAKDGGGSPEDKDAVGPKENKGMDPIKEPTIPTDPEERLAAITTAIGMLDEKDPELWTKYDGVPQVKAIENILGYDISAMERNEAWGRIFDKQGSE